MRMVKWMLECVNDPFAESSILSQGACGVMIMSRVPMRQAYDYKQDLSGGVYGATLSTPPLGESVYAPLRLTWSLAECPSLH